MKPKEVKEIAEAAKSWISADERRLVVKRFNAFAVS
jgi:hypothetical protein